MAYTITTQNVAAIPIAAVRRRVLGGAQMAEAWPAALSEVRAFLRTQRDLSPGRNVFLFHHPANSLDPLDVDFGVEVARAFPKQGEVVATTTPAGEVATTTHRGGHQSLMDAYAALTNWCVAHNRRHGTVSWYAYKEGGDPTQLETQVYFLLH